MELLSELLYYAPLLVAPLVLVIFSMISAYVHAFKIPKSGLGFDYIVFAIFVALALKVGGAI